MTSSKAESASSSPRFLFPDGLRGVASMMVVVFHLHAAIEPATRAWFPSALSYLFVNGFRGVEIFFVLSGFVIAHSVRSGARSWAYLGRFGLRRSIRLDPPLWTAILIEICLIKVGLMFFPALGTPLPGWIQVVTNVTYTQQLLRTGDILPVFWSLTYEVQFYLVLVTSLILLRRVTGSRLFIQTLFAAVYLYSLAIWMGVLPTPLFGLFIDRWFQFALGIAAWATFMRRIPVSHFALLCALTLAPCILLNQGELRAASNAVVVLTAISLAFVGMIGKMDRVLSGQGIQFLGKISYSMYLVHGSVGWRFIALIRKKWGPDLGPLVGSATFVGGVVLSMAAAWVIHVTLEAPSMKLARRVRLPVAKPEPIESLRPASAGSTAEA